MKDPTPAVITALKELLTGGHAHVTFEGAVKQIPPKLRGVIPASMPYSIWQLVEHIRITQWDILEFSRNPQHQSPPWPEGYWPPKPAPPNADAWKNSLALVSRERKQFISLLQKPGVDIYAPFPHGDGQHLLREALLIADHTSYHVGEIIVLRRMLGIWE